MKDNSPKLTIVMPAYNEEEALGIFLPEVIAHCQAKNYQLIVVNDGSKDTSKEVLERLLKDRGFSPIHHKVNRGYGGAIKSGIQAATTPYVITIDADGQHRLEDVDNLLEQMEQTEADLIIGSREKGEKSSPYRQLGKWIIRNTAKVLMPLDIYDLNSGMKIYDTELAQKYLKLCPNSMAFSDTITLVFINERCLVQEHPIQINDRMAGESTISTMTAFETIKQILNIVILFNPMRVFFPMAVFFIVVSILWSIRFLLMGRGLSVGAMLGITTGLIFFFLGLLAEQLSIIRRNL